MKQNIPDRIHIIGSVGSGKTTLARTLSEKYETLQSLSLSKRVLADARPDYEYPHWSNLNDMNIYHLKSSKTRSYE